MDGDRRVDPTALISGRRLTLPAGPIFHLKRADQCDYEIGEFRAWAGYKNFGSDQATDDLVHFQHVLTFSATDVSGRTGIHAHLAHAHVVIPTSGLGVFSYDGVVTEAEAGMVIVQHAGTVHDQFRYSHAGGSDAENRATPLFIEPQPPGAPTRSFGFLELFVPKIFANIEIVPPRQVTPEDQASAWDHPYHAPGERFFMQPANAPAAAYRPVAEREDLEVRDCQTWSATGGLVATWFIRPASRGPVRASPVSLDLLGEAGGVAILHVVSGSTHVLKADGKAIELFAGDTLTHSQELVGMPFDFSPDVRMICFFIPPRAQTLRQRTAKEIQLLEDLGPRVITRRVVRPEGDVRPVNFLHDPQ
jgi:hypothetical protein